MNKLFNHMLVPVDQEDEEGVVQQALHMADRLQCQVHLLYHVPAAQGEGTIGELKAAIRQRHPFLTTPGVFLEINTDAVFPEKQIVDYSKRHAVDLILLVKKKRTGHSLLRAGADVDRLVDKTLCPVLTVSGQPALSSLKNIVLPVGDHLPMRQLLFATYLGRTVNSTIHLVAPTNSNDHAFAVGVRDNLQKCYRLLRENTNLSIECQASPEENLAEAAWDYAKKIKADLILTSPGKESMLSGFWNNLRSKFFRRHGSRSLPNTSQIPVMTISNLS
ncbi:MAG TPA: universal stress protein [Puia sp.]|nr:universal stress protein [Puia sp.]